jgi:hypothetical protein
MDLSGHLVKQMVPIPPDVLHKRPKHDTLYRSVPARAQYWIQPCLAWVVP